MTDNKGLLDRYIDNQAGEVSAEIQYAFDFTTEYDGPSDFQLSHPAFYKLGQENQEVRVRMKQALAWAKFMMHVLNYDASKSVARSFFRKNSTHKKLFYTLIRHALDVQLHGADRNKKSDRIGVPQSIVEFEMKKVTGKSSQTVRKIINEAVDLGLVKVREFPEDRRMKMLWLVPEAMENYLTVVCEDFDGLATNGLPAARRDLLAAKENNANYNQDVRDAIRAAILSDKITDKN